MKRKNDNCYFIAAVFLLSAPFSMAQDSPLNGGYLGARAGYSYNENSCLDISLECDESDIGYGVFGGYNFHSRFGLELSYNDIGDSEAVYVNQTLDGKLKEIDLALVAYYPIYRNTYIYGKLGAAYWDGEVKGAGVATLSDDGVRPLVGAGLQFPLAERWSARIEYQYIDRVGNRDMGYTDPNFVGLSLIWHFSKPAASIAPKPVALPVVTPPPAPAPEQRIVIDEHINGPLFDFDKSNLRNTRAVDPVVDLLEKNPAFSVIIIGHTDSRGTEEYNQALSEKRAHTVAQYLLAKGIGTQRIETSGRGEIQPIADNATDEGRAKNRRVEFIISGVASANSNQ